MCVLPCKQSHMPSLTVRLLEHVWKTGEPHQIFTLVATGNVEGSFIFVSLPKYGIYLFVCLFRNSPFMEPRPPLNGGAGLMGVSHTWLIPRSLYKGTGHKLTLRNGPLR